MDIAPIIGRIDQLARRIQASHLMIFRVLPNADDLELRHSFANGERAKAWADQTNFVAKSKPPLLYCLKNNADQAFPPHPDSNPSASGRWWWHIGIGSGPARLAGYAVGAMVPARDEVEAMGHLTKIQDLFAAGGSDMANQPGQLAAASPYKLPIELGWVEVVNDSQLAAKDGPPVLKALRVWLRASRAKMCAVYQVQGIGGTASVELWGVYAPGAKCVEGYQQDGRGLEKAALWCGRLERDLVIKPPADAPRNADGGAWWNLIIGTDSVRGTGWITAAVIPAKDDLEVALTKKQIDRLFELFGERSMISRSFNSGPLAVDYQTIVPRSQRWFVVDSFPTVGEWHSANRILGRHGVVARMKPSDGDVIGFDLMVLESQILGARDLLAGNIAGADAPAIETSDPLIYAARVSGPDSRALRPPTPVLEPGWTPRQRARHRWLILGLSVALLLADLILFRKLH
jgi:hypothetical protein